MTESEALQSVVMDRIRELIFYRRWIKAHPSYKEIAKLDPEYRAELRSLVKLVRMGRKLAAATPDQMAAYGSFRDWTESEQRIAAGDR